MYATVHTWAFVLAQSRGDRTSPLLTTSPNQCPYNSGNGGMLTLQSLFLSHCKPSTFYASSGIHPGSRTYGSHHRAVTLSHCTSLF